MKNDQVPPYFYLLIAVGAINLFFSSYFISIFLCGVVLKIFLESLKKHYFYILFFSIITFITIEVNQGFIPFSLTAIALVLWYFIIPRVKYTFSSSIVSEIIALLLFYCALLVMVLLTHGLDVGMVYIVLYNFIIDIILIGFFI